MSLHEPPSPSEGRVWRTVREEALEVAWLVGIVGALSAASVALAAFLAVA
jgi:hypothetical protein